MATTNVGLLTEIVQVSSSFFEGFDSFI
jgi:hypothetical protein